MDSSLLARGLVIGFSIAAPVGPIGVLCIRRTLAEGRAHGLVSGLGAATADAIYGLIAGLGLTAISGFLVDQAAALKLVGGLFLIWLGLRTLRTRPIARAPEEQAALSRGGLLRAYSSTLALTLTNPATILAFTAIFAGAGLAESTAGAGAALALVAGVFAGSAAWWLLLSSGVGLLRARFTTAHRRWINRLSGTVLVGFGLLALAALPM